MLDLTVRFWVNSHEQYQARDDPAGSVSKILKALPAGLCHSSMPIVLPFFPLIVTDMDTTRSSSHKRTRRASTGRPPSPSTEEQHSRPSRASTSHHTQPSLPSIRHLHPYLPPSSMSQHIPGPGEGSSYSYPPPQQPYPPSGSQMHLSQQESSSLTMPAQMQPSDRPGRGDSDPEGDDHPGPPKKKRRRQALSCTG